MPTAVLILLVLFAFQTMGTKVNRFQDSAVERQKLRRETEIAFLETGDHENLRHVAVVENRVCRKVPCHLAERRLQGGLATRAADTGFGIADNTRSHIHHAGFHQRLDGKVRSRGIAAGIRYESRPGNVRAAELR